MRVMPPDTPYQGSPVNTINRRHNSSSGVSSHAGEKVFTRETVTTRVPASFLCGKSTIEHSPSTGSTSERVPSTGSTSSSSLTSVSSGATLSWNSDSPKLNISSDKTNHISPAGSKGSSPILDLHSTVLPLLLNKRRKNLSILLNLQHQE
ncbi:uncharacterized protein [Mytilus edulis]|uniref:uncharacterized protein n=1 Tax=Mytilus edulis TaxID=6550 RepID=UPI0039EEA606